MAGLPVIRVEDVAKRYRLGVIGRDLLTDELKEFWAGITGRPKDQPIRDPKEQRQGRYFWALGGVNFEVKEGEILGIVGRNGAGKSTLLKLLSRISLPTRGKISMRGRISSLLEVGTGFHPELTGRENIFLNGAIYGMRRAEITRKLDEIIAFSGIEHHIDTPIKRYSSGMKVRLGFSVAAHLDPEILIVDEVLAVGDADFQQKCIGSMRRVADSGRTILLVSHNMVPVRALSTRIVWMEKGLVRRDGPTDEVISEYLENYSPSTHEQVWEASDAPRTEEFMVTKVSATSERKDGAFYISDPVRIEVEVNNLAIEDEDLNLRLVIRTSGDVIAFISDLEDSIGERRLWKKGPSKVTCVIPGDLLNDGGYRFSIVFWRRGKMVLHVPDAIHIDIQEGVRKGTWFHEWKGVLRPKMAWIR